MKSEHDLLQIVAFHFHDLLHLVLLVLTDSVRVVLADLELRRAVLAQHGAFLEPDAHGMFVVLVNIGHVLCVLAVLAALILLAADIWRAMHIERG